MEKWGKDGGGGAKWGKMGGGTENHHQITRANVGHVMVTSDETTPAHRSSRRTSAQWSAATGSSCHSKWCWGSQMSVCRGCHCHSGPHPCTRSRTPAASSTSPGRGTRQGSDDGRGWGWAMWAAPRIPHTGQEGADAPLHLIGYAHSWGQQYQTYRANAKNFKT